MPAKFDFSFLDKLQTHNDKPDNHQNMPYPHLQIISGKSGSGKTHLLLKQLLTPEFLDYEELYILSPNIQQKEYQFINLGFENKLSKQILLDLFPRLEKFRLDQLEDLFKIVCDKVDYEDKQNDIKVFITSKKKNYLLLEK